MSVHAPHLAYVVAAYAASALGLGGLVVSSAVRAHLWRRRAAGRSAAFMHARAHTAQ